MIGGVLFDAAGTLIRLRGSVGEVYASIAARHGVAVEARQLALRFRDAFAKSPSMCFPDATPADVAQREYQWWRKLVSDVFEGLLFDDFDAFFAELFEYFARPRSWELFADVMPTLLALRRRGLRLGIVSNFDGRLFPICDGLDLTRHFETIVVSGRAGFAKPDPRIFGIALARLDRQTDEVVHVGDSAGHDLEGAHAAGLKAYVVDRDAAGSGPTTVTSLEELLDRI